MEGRVTEEKKIGERDVEVDYDRIQTRVCVGLVRVKNTWWGERRGLRLSYRNLEKIHAFPCILGRGICD